MNRTVLLIGATSAMAEQAARLFAAENATLLLAARDPKRLEDIAADLRIRGATAVQVLPPFDALDPQSHDVLLREALAAAPVLDIVLIAHGSLPDQARCEVDPAAQDEAMEINFSSPVRLCSAFANVLQRQGKGTLGVIASVAGLRGRKSNYVYGAAKGGLITFLQGLRNRLQSHGVRVVTFLPGFVDTPMTAHLPKGPLFASAATAGNILHRQLTRGRADIVYVPFFWRYILLIIRAIPEVLFKRMGL